MGRSSLLGRECLSGALVIPYSYSQSRRGRCSRATVRQKFVSRRNHFITVSVCSSKLTRKWFPVAPRRGGKANKLCNAGAVNGEGSTNAMRGRRQGAYLTYERGG